MGEKDLNKIMWDDTHEISKLVIQLAMKHQVPVEYIWNMINQTLQKDVFRLAESSEWIRKKDCDVCGKPGFHRIKLCSGSTKETWLCPTHSTELEENIDVFIKNSKKIKKIDKS
jgi:hypothetical protein